MFDKVNNHRFICALKFYFSGSFEIFNLSGAIPELNQRFYETIHHQSYQEDDPYFSRGSFNFTGNLNESNAGWFYKQSTTFRFPSCDEKRAVRLEKLRKIKYLGIILNDGTEYIMGRNDIYQNRLPTIETASNFHLTELKIETESIQPVLQIHSDGGSVPLIGYDYTYSFELA